MPMVKLPPGGGRDTTHEPPYALTLFFVVQFFDRVQLYGIGSSMHEDTEET